MQNNPKNSEATNKVSLYTIKIKIYFLYIPFICYFTDYCYINYIIIFI